ncbi:MAG: hypothetical protein JSV52_10510 [Candidatus Zixiibacteriota bacterium]|nr:MAG: hypothetical protein JSV52_10510 [candidate division Zixibacteria bacterium]
MNCQNIQDELLLMAGTERLPDDVQRHLDTCPECRDYWLDLTTTTENLGSEEDFYLDKTELESSIARVEERIDRLELEKVTDVRSAWLSHVPAAAAVVLLLGISFMAYMLGWFSNGEDPSTAGSQDTVWLSLENGDIDAIEESSIDYVMYRSATMNQTTSGELFYENLTEEELQYLEENFDVGEIL